MKERVFNGILLSIIPSVRRLGKCKGPYRKSGLEAIVTSQRSPEPVWLSARHTVSRRVFIPPAWMSIAIVGRANIERGECRTPGSGPNQTRPYSAFSTCQKKRKEKKKSKESLLFLSYFSFSIHLPYRIRTTCESAHLRWSHFHIPPACRFHLFIFMFFFPPMFLCQEKIIL